MWWLHLTASTLLGSAQPLLVADGGWEEIDEISMVSDSDVLLSPSARVFVIHCDSGRIFNDSIAEQSGSGGLTLSTDISKGVADDAIAASTSEGICWPIAAGACPVSASYSNVSTIKWILCDSSTNIYIYIYIVPMTKFRKKWKKVLCKDSLLKTEKYVFLPFSHICAHLVSIDKIKCSPVKRHDRATCFQTNKQQ